MSTAAPEMVAVIMAGGAGTRFWPLSTEERPKQFLRLFGEKSLLRQSFERVAPLIPSERVLVLTNTRYKGLVAEQIPELPPENIIGEPLRRDTAAAVTLAALICRNRFGNPVMCVLTADHVITPSEEFRREVESATRAASREAVLYTFGVPPTYPAVCYGYLEKGKLSESDSGIEHHDLVRFKEKPDRDTAERYVKSGDYLWNSGMFVWQVDTILAELERQLPGHIQALTPAVGKAGGAGWESALASAFESLKLVSIDYGVMEGAPRVRLVVTRFQWNDVGGWLALEEYLERDQDGNTHRGGLESLDAHGNLVFCEDASERVALIGVEGLLVVRAGGRTLIAPRERAEEVKALVKRLQGKG